MNKSFLYTLILLNSGILVRADSENSLPIFPSFPVLKNAPVYAKWTVICTLHLKDGSQQNSQSTQLSPNNRTLTKIQILKMNKDRHELFQWSDGKTSEKWMYHDFILFNQPESQTIYILKRHNMSKEVAQAFPDYATNDFPELNWIQSNAYIGTRKLGDHQCYFFRSESNKDSAPADPSKVSSYKEAWIDTETGLPVAMNNNICYQTYEFQSLTPGRLELSTNFLQTLQRYNEIANIPFSH